MFTMNTILFVIALAFFVSCYIIKNGEEVPVVLKPLSGYFTSFMVVSCVLMVVAIAGFFASFGGCVLYFYSIGIYAITIVCIVCTILAFVLYGLSKKDPVMSNILYDFVDKQTLNFISKEKNQEYWIHCQDSFSCCGYLNSTQTGKACQTPPFHDCRDLLFGPMKTYILYTAIVLAVLSVYSVILTIAAKATLKFECSRGC